MGDPRYSVRGGHIFLDGEDITDLPPDERARKGLFLAFQSPPEVEGVTLATLLLRAAGRERDVRAFSELSKIAQRVGLDPSYLSRPVNVGFSGGELICAADCSSYSASRCDGASEEPTQPGDSEPGQVDDGDEAAVQGVCEQRCEAAGQP